MELANEDATKILSSSNYREFIATMIEIRSARRRFGYADLSRRAGFASRSFPRDVIMGKKRISLKSVPQFTQGLGIKGDLALLFRLLVEKDHPDCRLAKTSDAHIFKKLENVRTRIGRENKGGLSDLAKPQVFTSIHYPLIYAALGDPMKGASINEIMKRTSLDRFCIKEVLESMEALGIVSQYNSRFKAVESHLALAGLKDSLNFKNFFLNCTERSILAVNEDLKSAEKLFFASCFSVPKSAMPRLKVELRSVLHKYVDENEHADGDHIARLCCSLL